MAREHTENSLRRRLRALTSLGLAVIVWPAISQAGLYTAPFGPTYNVGPESAWMNPAGMTSLKSNAMTAGVTTLLPVWEFDNEIAEAGGSDGDNSGVNTFLPTFFAVGAVHDRVRLGFSAFSPLGGPSGMGWDFGENFAGRYGSEGLTFSSAGFAPSIAFKLSDKWSIGGGASAQWLEVNQSTAINTGLPVDGKAELRELEDWSARYFGGLHFQMSPATSFGVVYRSSWDAKLEGDLAVEIPVTAGVSLTPSIQDFVLDVTLPQEIEVGIQQALSQTWILGLTFDWQNWTQFDDAIVDFSFANGMTNSSIGSTNFRDTYAGGVSLTHIKGANYINFGVNYASSPVSDGDRVIQLPADEALTLSLGAAHNASEAVTYSFGGAVAISGDASVDQNTQGFRFKGDFATNLTFVVGASVQGRF